MSYLAHVACALWQGGAGGEGAVEVGDSGGVCCFCLSPSSSEPSLVYVRVSVSMYACIRLCIYINARVHKHTHITSRRICLYAYSVNLGVFLVHFL